MIEFGSILDGRKVKPEVAIWAIVIVIKMAPPIHAEADIDFAINLVYFLSVLIISASISIGIVFLGFERNLWAINPSNRSDVEQTSAIAHGFNSIFNTSVKIIFGNALNTDTHIIHTKTKRIDLYKFHLHD